MDIMGALVATNTGGYSEPVIYPLEDLQKPRIYLLDEPGEDDPKGTSQIREAIVVSALDPHAAAAALPKLLPRLGIPVDAVGVVTHTVTWVKIARRLSGSEQ